MQADRLATLSSLFGFQGAEVGVDYGEGPPVPIPNTEVKLISADDTWLETARENRYSPTRQRAGIQSRPFDYTNRLMLQ